MTNPLPFKPVAARSARPRSAYAQPVRHFVHTAPAPQKRNVVFHSQQAASLAPVAAGSAAAGDTSVVSSDTFASNGGSTGPAADPPPVPFDMSTPPANLPDVAKAFAKLDGDDALRKAKPVLVGLGLLVAAYALRRVLA